MHAAFVATVVFNVVPTILLWISTTTWAVLLSILGCGNKRAAASPPLSTQAPSQLCVALSAMTAIAAALYAATALPLLRAAVAVSLDASFLAALPAFARPVPHATAAVSVLTSVASLCLSAGICWRVAVELLLAPSRVPSVPTYNPLSKVQAGR